uniref:Uncharacterized protein n=1 Tax=Sphaerodactylus townsendi TaxID=933632 RepID=A0ACB8GAZ3_9SAUR
MQRLFAALLVGGLLFTAAIEPKAVAAASMVPRRTPPLVEGYCSRSLPGSSMRRLFAAGLIGGLLGFSGNWGLKAHYSGLSPPPRVKGAAAYRPSLPEKEVVARGIVPAGSWALMGGVHVGICLPLPPGSFQQGLPVSVSVSQPTGVWISGHSSGWLVCLIDPEEVEPRRDSIVKLADSAAWFATGCAVTPPLNVVQRWSGIHS